jgi:ribulose-phosphate 3-epimerase
MKNIQVSASVLSADFLNLGEEIKKSEEAGVHSFHLDVMDNHLAPNLSFGPPIIKHIRRATKLPLDVHLMIDNPGLFLEDYIKHNPESILVHVEAYSLELVNEKLIKRKPRSTQSVNIDLLRSDLEFIKSKNIQAGVTLNPGTGIECVKQVLDLCDSVLFMSVNPGFSGQKFIRDVLPKIEALRKIYDKDIKVDGGVNSETAKAVVKAGANVLITSSYLYSSKNYKKAIKDLY